jgi:signal transduction histidine kinase
MAAAAGRLDRDACARGFVRAAQYFANMLASADVLAESRELIRGTFAPDVVCFCQRSHCAGDCCLPGGDREVLRRAVDQVIETGFVAMENLDGPSPAACVVLPVTVRGRTEAALVIGYVGERALPAHALEVLLGVAGLVGATLARQRADRELVALAEERAARAIAEVTERRTRLLAEASKAMFATFDFETSLASVARLLVPELADWCAVEVRDEDQPTMSRQVALVHVDPSKVEAVRQLGARSRQHAPRGPARVMATGQPELHPSVAVSSLVEWACDPEHRELARDLAIGSAMVVPIGVRGGVFGAITLAVSESSRRYGAEDLALAEEIGRRAGTAIENAHLYRQAHQAIAVRDQFLAIASHELKTPLTGLMLVVDGVARSLEKLPSAPALMRNKIAALSRQGRRLTDLVNNLLDVSRIQAGRLHVSIEEVDLCAVVRDVAERHGQEASHAGCELEVRAGAPVTGAWDQSGLDHVVSNLLSNAIKYGAGKPISLATESAGDRARLSVTDRGIGIAPADHERIFHRFERAVRSSEFAGMGLGLWIVREIVTRLGGSIRVESRLGEGACFTVELPVRQTPQAQSGLIPHPT